MPGDRLLVMDDEPDFADFVRRVGESSGFEVSVITDPRLFKKTYDAEKPDRIVLDIVMPDLDGIEIIEWLSSVGNKAPVLIVTGYNPHFAEAAKVFAKVKGRFSVTSLTKPMSVEDLREALKES